MPDIALAVMPQALRAVIAGTAAVAVNSSRKRASSAFIRSKLIRWESANGY